MQTIWRIFLLPPPRLVFVWCRVSIPTLQYLITSRIYYYYDELDFDMFPKKKLAPTVKKFQFLLYYSSIHMSWSIVAVYNMCLSAVQVFYGYMIYKRVEFNLFGRNWALRNLLCYSIIIIYVLRNDLINKKKNRFLNPYHGLGAFKYFVVILIY